MTKRKKAEMPRPAPAGSPPARSEGQPTTSTDNVAEQHAEHQQGPVGWDPILEVPRVFTHAAPVAPPRPFQPDPGNPFARPDSDLYPILETPFFYNPDGTGEDPHAEGSHDEGLTAGEDGWDYDSDDEPLPMPDTATLNLLDRLEEPNPEHAWVLPVVFPGWVDSRVDLNAMFADDDEADREILERFMHVPRRSSMPEPGNNAGPSTSAPAGPSAAPSTPATTLVDLPRASGTTAVDTQLAHNMAQLELQHSPPTSLEETQHAAEATRANVQPSQQLTILRRPSGSHPVREFLSANPGFLEASEYIQINVDATDHTLISMQTYHSRSSLD